MKNLPVILALLTCHTVMLLVIATINKVRPRFIVYDKWQQMNFMLLNYFHITCIVIMLLPACFINPLPIILLSFPDKISIEQTAVFLASFGIIGLLPWKKFSSEDNGANNIPAPLIPVVLYVFWRIVFLVVYEWFFRGLLLTSFSECMGTTWAVAINVLLYVTIHSHKTKKELVGCIPFGLLLCVFTIWWHSIWPAIIFHLEIATLNEWRPLQRFISPQKQAAL